jgi:hypothetical protein
LDVILMSVVGRELSRADHAFAGELSVSTIRSWSADVSAGVMGVNSALVATSNNTSLK